MVKIRDYNVLHNEDRKLNNYVHLDDYYINSSYINKIIYNGYHFDKYYNRVLSLIPTTDYNNPNTLIVGTNDNNVGDICITLYINNDRYNNLTMCKSFVDKQLFYPLNYFDKLLLDMIYTLQRNNLNIFTTAHIVQLLFGDNSAILSKSRLDAVKNELIKLSLFDIDIYFSNDDTKHYKGSLLPIEPIEIHNTKRVVHGFKIIDNIPQYEFTNNLDSNLIINIKSNLINVPNILNSFMNIDVVTNILSRINNSDNDIIKIPYDRLISYRGANNRNYTLDKTLIKTTIDVTDNILNYYLKINYIKEYHMLKNIVKIIR